MRWGTERWRKNEDGSYVRNIGGTSESSGYDGMTKAELQEELESRGLPKTGNKDELVARLNESDLAPVGS